MKYLVTLNTPADRETLSELGCDIIAEYPDSVLIRCGGDSMCASLCGSRRS